MTSEERLVADFEGTGMTVGPHPMAYYRDDMNAMGVLRAADLAHIGNGTYVRVAGAVICRQRPGTAKGFVFLSLEDETGISNVIITPDMFEQNRLTVVAGKFVLVEGRLQNVDNVISVKTARIETYLSAAPPSHRTIFIKKPLLSRLVVLFFVLSLTHAAASQMAQAPIAIAENQLP